MDEVVPSESAGDDSDSSVPDVPFEKGATHPSVDDGVSTWATSPHSSCGCSRNQAGSEHDDVEREDTAGLLEEPRQRRPTSYTEIMQTFTDESYDPRMPQYIRPARREEVIWEELKCLREQVARIVPMLDSRQTAGHDEALLLGYRQVLAEARLRIPDLEWAYAQPGKLSKDSANVPAARGLHSFALRRPPLKHEVYFASVARPQSSGCSRDTPIAQT